MTSKTTNKFSPEVRERAVRQANEILRKASAYFALAPFDECRHSPVG